MATITPVSASSAGATITFAAASVGGDSVAVGSAARCSLLVRNASGGSINVTLAGAITCSQGSLHNAVVACAVGDTHILLPAQAITVPAHNVGVTYSAVTSVTVAAVSS